MLAVTEEMVPAVLVREVLEVAAERFVTEEAADELLLLPVAPADAIPIWLAHTLSLEQLPSPQLLSPAQDGSTTTILQWS